MASKPENTSEARDEPPATSAANQITDRAFGLLNRVDIWSVFGGMVLATGFIFLANPISRSSAVGVLNHNLSPVFITLYVALSAGHYLGLSITGSDKNFIDGMFGGFIVFSAAVAYWSVNSGMTGLPIALVGLFLGIVMAHHRGWVKENKYIDSLLELFGRGVVPLGLAGAVLIEIVLPLILSTQIDEFYGSLHVYLQTGLLFVLTAAIYALGRAIGAVENID